MICMKRVIKARYPFRSLPGLGALEKEFYLVLLAEFHDALATHILLVMIDSAGASSQGEMRIKIECSNGGVEFPLLLYVCSVGVFRLVGIRLAYYVNPEGVPVCYHVYGCGNICVYLPGFDLIFFYLGFFPDVKQLFFIHSSTRGVFDVIPLGVYHVSYVILQLLVAEVLVPLVFSQRFSCGLFRLFRFFMEKFSDFRAVSGRLPQFLLHAAPYQMPLKPVFERCSAFIALGNSFVDPFAEGLARRGHDLISEAEGPKLALMERHPCGIGKMEIDIDEFQIRSAFHRYAQPFVALVPAYALGALEHGDLADFAVKTKLHV